MLQRSKKCKKETKKKGQYPHNVDILVTHKLNKIGEEFCKNYLK